METDFSGEQSYSQAEPSDSSIGDTSISISSDDIQKGTTNNFGTSFADDAQATVDPSNVLSQASFNETMGITALNPFGKDNFFTRAFGIDPRSLDYSGMGIDLGGTADLAYDRYLNPLVENKDGTFSLRSGLSAGERTRLGDIIEVDRRMGPGEQVARTVFGLGTPIGMFTSALGTTSQTGTAVQTLDSLTIGAALSGASGITGEGNVGVIAPSDQLDFNIGAVTIDIFTQVDAPSVTMASALGSSTISADALVTLGSLTSAFSLGTETVEVGTGVIVSVSTVALTFAEGTTTPTAGATVNVTGVDLSFAAGIPFSTPWSKVVTGASNVWTEVDAA